MVDKSMCVCQDKLFVYNAMVDKSDLDNPCLLGPATAPLPATHTWKGRVEEHSPQPFWSVQQVLAGSIDKSRENMKFMGNLKQ